MILIRYISVISILLVGPVVAAQEQGAPAGEIEDQQVIIEKDKPLTLPKANRIYQRTDIRTLETDTIRMNYQITQPTYNFNPYFAQFDFKAFDPETEISEDFNNYIKAGFGNYGSPLVQGYFGVDYEGNSAGVWLNHESFSKGPVRDEESAYSTSEVLLSGTLTGERVAVSPEIHYQRESYFFYGYDADRLEAIAPDMHPFITDRISTNHFALSAEVNTWEADKFQLSVSPFYRYTNMKEIGQEAFNAEHQAGLDSEFEIELSELFDAGVEAGYTHFNYLSGLEQTRDVIQVNPFLVFENEVLRLRAGIRYFSANDSLSENSSYLYPDLEAKFGLAGNLGVFARLSGQLEPTSLNDLRLTNRYLQGSLALLNQNVKVDFRGGVEATLSEKVLLRGYIQYRQINNQPLFFHSFSDSSRFSVLYDPESFSEFGIGVEGRYFLGKQTSVSGNLLLLGYETDTVSEAWYLPALRFNLTASHTIGETLRLRTSFIVLEGIKAPDPVTFEPIDLSTIVNWEVGAQYDFVPNAGAFVTFENILSGNYERYLNYPSRGFMVKLGFIYRF